ncbi:MAG: putative hypothetical exported or envelope protein [Acidimicrobiales bacterium]|nr:putative hypothetical exported or envelope protein [Acidimicrobiales bacterium]
MVRRAVALVCSAVVAGGLVAPLSAHAADAPPSGGQIVDGCKAQQDGMPSVPGAVTPGPAACRNVAQVDWGAARACRTIDASAPDQCQPVDGRAISPADLKAYQSSWVHRALTLQRGMDLSAPLFESLLPHTHNTFNSSAYGPTLTDMDPNQVYSITDQLNMDIRLIEMDLHWVPSIFGNQATGGYWVTLCHGNSGNPLNLHIGCTNDRPFQDGLAEVKKWLGANPTEFVVIYLENQLSGNASAHALAAKLINDALGGLIEKPAAGSSCAPMDWNHSRASMLAVGHHVAFVGNCDAGAHNAWGTTVFERGPNWDEHGGQVGYSASSQQCTDDRSAHDKGVFRRYFEDSTWLAATVGSNAATSSLGGTSTIDAAQTAAMVACGVNIIGFDQLTPTDPRLAALVWSWARDEPKAGAGDCAVSGADGRFRAAGCRQRKRAACVDAAGWHVTAAATTWAQAFRSCPREFGGSRFAAPVNGYRNTQLVAAKGSVTDVWVNDTAAGPTWTANGPPPPRRRDQSGQPGHAAVVAAPVVTPARLSARLSARPASATRPGRSASGPMVAALAVLVGLMLGGATAVRRLVTHPR